MRRIAVTVAAVLTVAGLVLVYFVPGANPGASTPQTTTPPPQNEQATDLGVTFLPLTPGLAEYYNLSVKAGALITEVASGSLADRGGLKNGDVILSYNGIAIENSNSLLGAIRGCPLGATVVMRISRAKSSQTISFVHSR